MLFITEVTSVPVVALSPTLPVCLWLLCYQGYQFAYGCLLLRLPVGLPLICYQGYQYAYGCFVTKATSLNVIAC